MADKYYLKDNLSGLVPVDISYDIMKGVQNGSALLKLANIQQMTTDTKKFTVQMDTPEAYWVDEAGTIKTAVGSYAFPTLTVKKLAVIIPVTNEKLNDSVVDVFGEYEPLIVEAFSKEIDSQGLFGKKTFADNNDNVFNSSIFASLPEGNKVPLSPDAPLDSTVSYAFSKVETADLDVNAIVSTREMKHSIRNLRDESNRPYYIEGTSGSEFFGTPITFAGAGFKKDEAKMLLGDWKYAIVGLRSDIEYKILDQATLDLADGTKLNLAAQDMVAIRATMRIGFLNIKPDAFAAVVPAQN